MICKKGIPLQILNHLTKTFLNSFTIDTFLFVTEIIPLLVMTLVMYKLCNHMKFKMLVISLALQQIKEVDTVTRQEDITLNCTYKTQWYIILMLRLSILG